MDTKKKIFATAQQKNRSDGSLVELAYDDVIRVLPSASSGVASSDSYHLLEGQSVTAFSCPDPKCISGTPPLMTSGLLAIEVQKPTEIVASMPGGPACLVAGANGSQISIPIFDASIGTGKTLCEALSWYRTRVGRGVAFHVYEITDAPGELAQLQSKHIAIPIPSMESLSVAAIASAEDEDEAETVSTRSIA
jgi:hypothetical protein